MRQRGGSGPLLGLVSAVLVLTGGARDVAAKHVRDGLPPKERTEYRSTEQALGYREGPGNYAVFGTPYNRKTIEAVAGRITQPALSPTALYLYFGILTRVVQHADGWEAPAEDVRELLRPAIARAAEELGKRPAAERSWEELASMEAARCLWNADYALAWADRAKAQKDRDDAVATAAEARLGDLEKEAIAIDSRPHRADYVGDLVVWALREKLDVAGQKLAALAKRVTRDDRQLISSAQAELRVRWVLGDCGTTEAMARVLASAAGDRQTPLPARAWAIRSLARFPTPQAIAFLLDVLRTARTREGEYELGIEAQEVLGRLGRLPANVPRYDPLR